MCRNYWRCDVGRAIITKTSKFHNLSEEYEIRIFNKCSKDIDRFENIQIQICKFSRKKLILLMRAGSQLAVSTCAWVSAGGGRGWIGAHACRGGSRTRHSTLARQASRPALRRRPPQHSHRQVTHLSCPLLIINCLHHYPVPSML